MEKIVNFFFTVQDDCLKVECYNVLVENKNTKQNKGLVLC